MSFYSTKDTCTEVWGDGKRFSSLSTYCDDGNTSNGDGWSSSWGVESGWNWSGGSTALKDVCIGIWGDGKNISNDSSIWDDGNSNNGDGCSSAWKVEAGYKWSHTTTTPDLWIEIWGDGIKLSNFTAHCDDGNILNGDGWNSNCSIESGWNWSGGTKTTKDIWNEIWGDGIKFNTLDSYCDDGNNKSDDGCTSKCSIESGYKWSGGSSVSKDVWSILITTQEAAAATATQSTVAVGASISSGASLLSMSSPIGVFASVNQFQLLIFIQF